jgi:serine-aspartate repeat-containing protein C/D/E
VILVGTVYNTVEEQSDILLARFDESGEEVWSYQFGGEENESGQSVVALTTGGFLVGGSTTSYGNGARDIFILRIEDDGDLIWQETYGTGADEGACRIREVADGYIASGFRMSQNDPTLLIVKFDEYGDMVWNESYTSLGELGITQGIAVEPLTGGGYITSGIFEGTNDSLQSMVVKLDAQGGIVWSTHITGAGSESILI